MNSRIKQVSTVFFIYMLQVGQNAYNWHTKNVVQFKNFWQYHIKNNDNNNNNNNYKFTRFNIITEKLKLGIASTTDIVRRTSKLPT